MPRRPLPFGSDTLTVPIYLAKGSGYDDPGFQRWKRDHPDCFAAGHWTPAQQPRQAKPPVPDGGNATRRLSATQLAELASFGAGPLDPSTLSVSEFQRVAADARAESARESPSGDAIEHSVPDPAAPGPSGRSYAPVPQRSANRSGLAAAGDADQHAAPVDGPSQVAIDFDPRTVALTPSAGAVEDEINRMTSHPAGAAEPTPG